MRNLQEQVKKAFCCQKFFWLFTVWINCSSDLKIFANYQLSASNFKSFSRSLENFFLLVTKYHLYSISGNKINNFKVLLPLNEIEIWTIIAWKVPVWFGRILAEFLQIASGSHGIFDFDFSRFLWSKPFTRKCSRIFQNTFHRKQLILDVLKTC